MVGLYVNFFNSSSFFDKGMTMGVPPPQHRCLLCRFSGLASLRLFPLSREFDQARVSRGDGFDRLPSAITVSDSVPVALTELRGFTRLPGGSPNQSSVRSLWLHFRADLLLLSQFLLRQYSYC